MLYFASNTTAGSDGLMYTFHTEMKSGSRHNDYEGDVVTLQVMSLVLQARLSHGEERVWSNSHQALVLHTQQQGT